MSDNLFDRLRAEMIANGLPAARHLSDEEIAAALMSYLRRTGLTFVEGVAESVAPEASKAKTRAARDLD